MGGFADDYNCKSEIHIEITVDRDELLMRIKENRETHRKAYELAIEEWRFDLEKALDKIKPNACTYWPEILTDLKEERPVSHLDEYDRAIDMFQMCMKSEIKLNSGIYRKLCRDEWDWKTKVLGNRYFLSAYSSI